MNALSYQTFLAYHAQIGRLRRQRIADHAWATAIGTRDKPHKAIAKLEQ